MVIGIIGGGASGMAAVLAAAQNPDVTVILFERQARLGRKLLATGNGRCNLSNIHAAKGGYHGEDPGFSAYALAQMNPEDTLTWFRDLGLVTVTEPSGRVYPYSDQANSVLDVLRYALERPNIQLRLGQEVQKVSHGANGFTVYTDEDHICCDRLIVACGGLAGTKLGGSMSGYKLLAKLGHKATKLRPALVQLKSSWGGVVSLKGVRANCHVQIFHDGVLHAQSTGEMQFTDYGISGPVVFEISRDVCYGGGAWSAKIDFIPQWNLETLYEALERRLDRDLPAEELLTGILHNRLGRVLVKAAGIRDKDIISELTPQQLRSVCAAVKGFELALTEPMGMDHAQVTAGGVLTRDFDPRTMQSRLVPGLYACGEVLDIDGDCGGYNLQWAWSSGFLAGKSAGEGAL